MYAFVDELLDCLHFSPFDVCCHLMGLLVSSVFLVLHDEQISFRGEFKRDSALWLVFLPLWCSDIVSGYFNLLVFTRRVLFHKKYQSWLRKSGLSVQRHRQPGWAHIVGDAVYSLLCCLCLFLFKLLLYQKLLNRDESNLSYGVVFLPLMCYMHLLLLCILVGICLRCCS
ncbi:hypothetical protein EG68_03867 [Paragonimus skrjabini miyazakii]|uniref:Uncharacterized protein n=1 Tax=Paragonimus skrjabini miyazakii TaxID=59628 RepID=A0A8S9Z0G0_9TREM|nr:hypothetical protein EG68_03867 [Paragonimus skrjabini miyazakii]